MPIRKDARRIVKHLKPAVVMESRFRRKVFRDFSDKLGFVYFGYIDQRDDEHRLIRGLTQSSSHRDDHYCIGSYHGYDIALCERADVIKQHSTANMDKKWLIVTADLHRKSDVPHAFIGLSSLGAGFYRSLLTKYPYMQQIEPGGIMPYDSKFREIFSMYVKPTHAVAIEQLLGGELNAMLVGHFSEFSFELSESTLYIYADNKRPTNALLSRMLQCVAWLASEIDKR